MSSISSSATSPQPIETLLWGIGGVGLGVAGGGSPGAPVFGYGPWPQIRQLVSRGPRCHARRSATLGGAMARPSGMGRSRTGSWSAFPSGNDPQTPLGSAPVGGARPRLLRTISSEQRVSRGVQSRPALIERARQISRTVGQTELEVPVANWIRACRGQRTDLSPFPV
jgi:hypothetical protein